MLALLDVNVPIALLDENHTQNASASAWFEDNVDSGWASCPLTQNGCIRIIAQPGYPNATGLT
ncbi:MAG: VapC toxin family PIN domain ribonuclease, partial [Gammaproteobacteria bacterium]|nr:VapC toxin family PIN domain ribonuclease [Gammaproteobacteria bacterium]